MIEPQFTPPFFSEYDIMIILEKFIFLNNIHSMDASCSPIIVEARQEIQLFTSFSRKVDCKPLKEFSLSDKHVSEIVVI